MFRKNQTSFHAYLVQLSDVYYNTSSSTVSDQQFDALVEEYEDTYSTTFDYIGSPNSHHKKCQLPVPMASLNKCKDIQALQRFGFRFQPQQTGFVFSEKLDGISLLLVIQGSKIIKAFTRGNGIIGTDVSHILPLIQLPASSQLQHLQQIFNTSSSIYVRGELLLPNKPNESSSLLRNIICGAVNALHPDKNVLQQAHFVAYNIPQNASQEAKIQIKPSALLKVLSNSGFIIPLYSCYDDEKCLDIQNCNAILTSFKQQSKYNIDGLVIAHDDFYAVEDADKPKHTVAFKRSGDMKETFVVQVCWEISRYGRYHPTIQIEPVQIDGSTITFVTGNHAEYIVNNNIGPGTKLLIERSGDVIPKINSILEATNAQLPTTDKGDKYEWDGVHLKAIQLTKEAESEQQISRLTYACKAFECKGLSQQTVTKLYYAGYTDELKLFSLTIPQIVAIDGFQQKSATNIFNALQSAKEQLTLVKILLASAYFGNFGERKLTNICEHIDIPKYLEEDHMSISELQSHLQDVSVVSMSYAFAMGCKEFRENPVCMQLLQLVKMKKKSSLPSQPITTTVVFSGFRDKKLSELCLTKGIKCVDTVTKNVNVLVIADEDSVSSKVATARKLGIRIMLVNDFVASFINKN